MNLFKRCHEEDCELQKKIEDLNGKLDTYKVTVMYREQDLAISQSRGET